MDSPPTKPALPDHWEPRPHERKYVRHVMTGDRGYFVRREGKDCIRLDRPNEDVVRPYREHTREWVDDSEERPFSDLQISRVAFEADKALCLALGQHDQARRDWSLLSDDARAEWMQAGPKESAHPKRKQLWGLIRRFMKG